MMKRKKAALWIVLITLGLWPLSGLGAVPSDFEMKSIDHAAFFANYKQEQSCEWGKKAAVYQRQIYYSDPANGGIFRMELDGSQCEWVAQSPDIRKLQLFPEGIYYLGFVGNAGEKKDEYRSFRLFFFDWVRADTLDLMEMPMYSQLLAEKYGNAPVVLRDLYLWDFYRTEQGTITNLSVSSAPAGLVLNNDWFSISQRCTSLKGPIPRTDFTAVGAFPLNQQDTTRTFQGSGHPEIFVYDQLLFSAEAKDQFVSISQYSEAWESFSVTDQKKNLLVMDTDAIYRLYGQVSRHRTVDGFHQGGVLAHVANEMILMSGDFQDPVRSVLLEGEEAIRFVVVGGDAAYLIAEKGTRDRQQSVYQLDLGTFAYQKLYTCAQSEKFLWVETKEEERVLCLDAERLVTAQGKAIRIWTLENGEYQLNRTLETKQNVVANINKTDVAGDWLFVYQFNKQENRDELMEKVSIAVE